jgi:hypothetical protein
MTDNKEVKTELEKEEEKPWSARERVKPVWVVQTHGEFVKPQCDQKSNNALTDEQVLQPRDEPVTLASTAKPLTGRTGTAGGASDEPSGAKRTYPTGR